MPRPARGPAAGQREATLVKRADARQLGRRVFVAQLPLATYDAGCAADALSRAANQVIDAIIVWLSEVETGEAK